MVVKYISLQLTAKNIWNADLPCGIILDNSLNNLSKDYSTGCSRINT